MTKDLKKFYKAVEKLEAHKKARKELAEAVAGYILVAREDFLFKVADLINEEEDKT